MWSCHGEMEESGLSLLEHKVSSVAPRHLSYPMKDDVKLGFFFLSAKKESSRRNRMNPKPEKTFAPQISGEISSDEKGNTVKGTQEDLTGL